MPYSFHSFLWCSCSCFVSLILLFLCSGISYLPCWVFCFALSYPKFALASSKALILALCAPLCSFLLIVCSGVSRASHAGYAGYVRIGNSIGVIQVDRGRKSVLARNRANVRENCRRVRHNMRLNQIIFKSSSHVNKFFLEKILHTVDFRFSL